jgi:hypothetical protein
MIVSRDPAKVAFRNLIPFEPLRGAAGQGQ